MEADEAESLLAAIDPLGDLGAINFSALTEVILELAPSSLPGEVAYEELAALLGGRAGHVARSVLLVVPTNSAATVVVAAAMMTVGGAALFTIFSDEDRATVQLSVLQLADGTCGFM